MNDASQTKRQRRGANRKTDCVLVGVWLPKTMIAALDIAVQKLDTDRSKLMRSALREKLGRN